MSVDRTQLPPDRTQLPQIHETGPDAKGSREDLRIEAVATVRKQQPTRPHRFRWHCLLLVISGHGQARFDDGHQVSLSPDHGLCIPAGSRCSYGPQAGETMRHHYLSLSGPGWQPWIACGLLPMDRRSHNLPDARTIELSIESLHRLLADPSPQNLDMALSPCLSLLTAIKYHTHQSPSSDNSQLLHYCQTHFREDINFQALAHAHDLSYPQLRYSFLSQTGLPPGRYLARLRCDEARRLLVQTELGIEAIGQRIGIPHPVSFSRFFKRQTGLSPSSYRASIGLGG